MVQYDAFYSYKISGRLEIVPEYKQYTFASYIVIGNCIWIISWIRS